MLWQLDSRLALSAATMTKKSQLLVIIFISTAQLTLMLLTVVWVFGWVETESLRVGQSNLINVNSFVARQVSEQIEATQLESVEVGSDDFRKLQQIVTDVQFPGDGFVSIVDATTGRIIAHPAALRDSSVIGQDWDAFVTYPVPGSLVKSLQHSRLSGNRRVHLKMGDSMHVAHFQSAESLNAIVLSHRNIAEAHAISPRLMGAIKKYGFTFVLILGLLGTVLNIFVVKRIRDQDLRIQSDLEDKVDARTQELVQIKNAIIFGLAKLAESRDNDTGEHLDRIRKYVTILATDLVGVYDEIDAEFIQHLAVASSLHDIGKVGIPDSILLKPGKLTTLERAIMQKHTTIGGECLEAIGAKLGDNDFLEMAREVAYWHHEQWDGNGYPHRLTDDQIPISARIVAVADVYDALTSRRPYKRGLTHTESRAIILSGSGQKFDPEVVSAFLRHEAEFQKIARRYQTVESETTEETVAPTRQGEIPTIEQSV